MLSLTMDEFERNASGADSLKKQCAASSNYCLISIGAVTAGFKKAKAFLFPSSNFAHVHFAPSNKIISKEIV